MKRCLIILLVLSLMLSLFPFPALASEPYAVFDGGTGTEENPYLVSTALGLDYVRQLRSAHFRQTADIDLSGWGSWEPITNFRGSYDGGGFQITNLTVSAQPNRQNGLTFGLFGTAMQASFKNIKLTGLSIQIDGRMTDFYGLVLQGYDPDVYVGGICAESGSSTFENCSVSGSIRVTDCAELYVGGIAGANAYLLRNCTNGAEIFASSTQLSNMYGSGYAFCGGITGWCHYSTVIEGCSNTAAVQLSAFKEGHLGGIVGQVKGPVHDCVNFGEIYFTGDGQTGGIAGTVSGELTRCVNYGNVSASLERDDRWIRVGGIAGMVEAFTASGSVTHCYNLAREINHQKTLSGKTESLSCGRIYGSIQDDSLYSSPEDASPNGCGSFFDTRLNGLRWEEPENAATNIINAQGRNLTAEELLLQQTYEGFDFTSVWRISFEHGGAVLSEVTATQPEAPVTQIIPFCELTYRADYLTGGSGNILSNVGLYNSLISCSASPCRIIVDAHGEDMRTAASAWNALVKTLDTLTGDPDYAITHDLRQHDLLVAYILDAVGTQTEHQVADTFKDITKEASDLTGVLSDLIQNFEGEKQLFSDYFTKNMDKFMEGLDQFYEKHDPQIKGFLNTAEGLKIVANIAKECANFTELIDNLVGFVNLYNASESTKRVLRIMYRLCPEENENLKTALGTVCQIMDAASETLFAEMLAGKVVMSLSVNSGVFVIKKLFDYAAKELAAGFPMAGAALAICKAEAYVVDKLFGVDKTVEQYFKMCALMELDQLAGLAVNQAIIDYKEQPHAENAQVLLSAIDLKRSLIDRDFTEAIKYVRIIEDEGIVRKVKNALNAGDSELKEQLLDLRGASDTLLSGLQTAWLIPLAQDYPELAQFYDRIGFTHSLAWEISIHCPVDVELYDAKGNLAASISTSSAAAFASLGAVYDDGSKHLLLPAGSYRIVCRGYDKGSMDVEVLQYGTDGLPLGTAYYHDLAVAADEAYTLSVEADAVLRDSDGQPVTADYDSRSDQTPQFEVSVENGLILGDDVGAAIHARPGQTLQIMALVPEDCSFTGWRVKKGDAQLSNPKDASTTFIMTAEPVVIKAAYKKNDASSDASASDSGIKWMGLGIGAVAVLGGVLLCAKKRKPNR